MHPPLIAAPASAGPARYSRRTALKTGGVAALALMAAPTLLAATGCARSDGPDLLEDLISAADDDAAVAGHLAEISPDPAPATVIAEQRRAHAAALRAEVDRLRTDDTDTDRADGPAAPSPIPDGDAAAVSAALGAMLRGAAEQAYLVAQQTSGYRAGLTGSIGAACAAQAEVIAQ